MFFEIAGSEILDIPISEGFRGGKRFYSNGNSIAPSVTTVLGLTKDNSFLNSWNRNNPGVKEAAAKRGKEFHSYMEKYFIEGAWMFPVSEISRFDTPQLRSLVKTMTPVFIETPVFSNHYLFAGRADAGMIIELPDGDFLPVFVDWKTADKPKTNWYDYPLQLAAYLRAFAETYGDCCDVQFSNALIVCAHPKGVQLELFDTPTIDFYWQQFQTRLEYFHEHIYSRYINMEQSA